MYLIREKAFEILVDIYKNCDSSLTVKNFSVKQYNVDSSNLTKSFRYLTQMNYIEKAQSVIPKDVTITGLGIDKAEDIIIKQK